MLRPRGAYIMGRNMFGPIRGEWDEEWSGWWGAQPPYHAPVFVLTHHAHALIEMEGGTTFHFVTDGFDAAYAQARETAGADGIDIAGGASTVRQALLAGVIDALWLDIAPVLLGSGEGIFNGVAEFDFEPAEVLHSPLATHICYRRVGWDPDTTMKYMILLYDNADMREIFSSRSDLMEEMAGLLEIRQSGELVATEPLADPVQTKTVRPADGPPVVTDGPLAEAKEHFGGYLIVDCETNERAVEIAAKWPSARFAPMESGRSSMSAAPTSLRPTSTSCARWRRRCSPCSCAATARLDALRGRGPGGTPRSG